MTIEQKIKDIILTMIDYNLLDSNRLFDSDYVAERIKIYLEAKNFINENFKGCF